MKKNLLFLGMTTMIAASQMLTACSSDELETPSLTQQSQDAAISLTSALQASGSRRAASDPQTAQLNTATKVGVFGIANNATITNGNNNQYSVEANGDLTSAVDMIWPSDGSASIYAYAPYAEDWTYDASNAFSVATNQTSEAGYLASDLVYGTPATNPVAQTIEAVPLSFTHKLAKLNITIDQDADSELDLTEGSVTITNTKIATTFNPSTGEVGEATGEAADIAVASALGTARTACAILVPQQVAAGTVLVKIVADGKQLNAKLGAATTFVGGKSYNFTVKISKVTEPVTEVTLKLGSTSVVGWDNEDLGAAPADGKLYAEFGNPGSNATYDAESFTYNWTAGNSNLMNCFTFANGELANYSTLHFTFSDITEGKAVRINILYSDNSSSDKNYYSAGSKTETLSSILKEGKTAADVTAIRFGGANVSASAGACVIKAADMYLE